ncbi:hypothetical protein V6N13_020077 [Hibiscus sabdariffa]
MRLIDDYEFISMAIWVRILRVPIGLMLEALGCSLGACLGAIVCTDTRVLDGNMRVRLVLDASKPLRRYVALGGCGDKPKLYPLQYEKLPIFCHGYGIVGHLVSSCHMFKMNVSTKLQYDDWMRVAP